MFRSRRGTLVKRLWKTRLRTTTGVTTPTGGTLRSTGEGTTASASGCYEYCGIGRPVEPGERSEDEGASQTQTQNVEDEVPLDAPQPFLTKSQVFAFLEQLEVGQLEALLCAIRTGAEEVTACVMVSSSVRLFGSLDGIPLPVLCGQLWRWPKAKLTQLCMRKLPLCESANSECSVVGKTTDSPDCQRKNPDVGVQICCNPYHWSIRTLPDAEVSSVYYTNLVSRCSNKAKSGLDEFTFSSESAFSVTASSSYDTQSSHGSHWCTVAYWEQRQRVGRLYIVDRDWVNIFQQLPHGYGLCLALMQAETSDIRVRKARDKIGLGLVLSKETDGVWVYNRSCHPIFVNHLAVVTATRRTTKIQKLPPGCSLRIFDYSWHELLKRTRDAAAPGDGPSNPYCAQVSFVKGWGPNYSRQTVIQCPCWIEILLHVNR